jgi:ankyrin repeat protein
MKMRILGACITALAAAIVAGCTDPEPAIPAAAQDINPYIKAEDRLIHAIEKGNVAAVEEALNTGSDPNSPGSGALPPLEVAASFGFIEAGQKLLAKGADIDRVAVTKVRGKDGEPIERRGNAPLHTAVQTGQIEFVKWLLDNKADINVRNGRNSTPLDVAMNSAEMLKSREELAKEPEIVADIAARTAKTQEVIKLLEERGAKTTQDFEAKKLEEIKGGGIIGRLPPEIRGTTISPKPVEKPKLESEPRLDERPAEAPVPSPLSVP